MTISTEFDHYGTLQKLTIQLAADAPSVTFTFPVTLTPEMGDGTRLFGLVTTADFYVPVDQAGFYVQDTYRFAEITSTPELPLAELEDLTVQALEILNGSSLFNLYSFSKLDISQSEHTVQLTFVDDTSNDPVLTQVALPDGNFGWVIDVRDLPIRDARFLGLQAQFSQYLTGTLSYIVTIANDAVSVNYLDRRVLTAQPGVLHSLFVETLDFEHRLRLAKVAQPVAVTEDDYIAAMQPMVRDVEDEDDEASVSEYVEIADADYREFIMGRDSTGGEAIEAIEDGVFEEVPVEPHTTH